MAERPTPVVMCSTLTEKGCETTLQALAAGAVSFITKPKMGLRDFLVDQENGLGGCGQVGRTGQYAGPRLSRQSPRSARAGTRSCAAVRDSGCAHGGLERNHHRVVAIGISTGGVQSIEVVLRGLDRTCPGIVMVQHMPERFTASFAARPEHLVRPRGPRSQGR